MTAACRSDDPSSLGGPSAQPGRSRAGPDQKLRSALLRRLFPHELFDRTRSPKLHSGTLIPSRWSPIRTMPKSNDPDNSNDFLESVTSMNVTGWADAPSLMSTMPDSSASATR